MSKRALITGIAGQDGSYLSQLLLDRDYEVFGIPGPTHPDLIAALQVLCGGQVCMLPGDLTDMASIVAALEQSRPHEVYNLAALSFVGDSWENALLTTEVNAVGVLRLLEAIRQAAPGARFAQASSAEAFDTKRESPQRETTPLSPHSPYAVAKAYAQFMTVNYRESHGMYASNAIFFNHESPRRPPEFVTRKITSTVARIKLGLADELRLGNLNAQRDWGFAADYVRGMWLMVQQDEPGDFVFGTGETHSVREFCELAFARAGLDWERYVVVDPDLFRPVDVEMLVADASKARSVLAWEPAVPFDELVAMMVDSDLQSLAKEAVREPGPQGCGPARSP